jgi:hypothetical protein
MALYIDLGIYARSSCLAMVLVDTPANAHPLKKSAAAAKGFTGAKWYPRTVAL